jgi:cysteine-rich repeat protein
MMGMFRSAVVAVVVAVGATGCIHDDLVVCGDHLCPANMVCAPVGCVTHEQSVACHDKAEGDTCTTIEVASGICVGGACRASVCGDQLVEFGEACDDGNTVPGDGCSGDCRSTEVCGNGVADGIAGEQCDSGVAGVSADGCSSRCTIEFEIWRDVTPVARARSGHALAYDRGRDVVVAFSGLDDTGTCIGGTFEWNGRAWRTRHPPAEPAPRFAAVAVFDARRGRTVIFGGADHNGNLLNDTWAWDGVAWTQLATPTAPPAREYAAGVYDDARGTIVIYGGYDGDLLAPRLDDVWELDGVTWTSLGAGPGPRSSHVMAYDRDRDRIVVFGGFGDLGAQNDTWEWDGATWQQAAPAASPTPRADAAMVFDASGHRTVMFGGSDGASLDETWTWDGASWTAIALSTSLAARANARAVFDDALGKIVLSGGIDNQVPTTFADTWVLSGAQWSEVTAAVMPAVIGGACVTFDARRGTVLEFGGASGLFAASNAIWEWTGSEWIDRSPTSRPRGRGWAGLAYDSRRARAVLFGGHYTTRILNGFATSYLADTWVWDGASWTEVTPSGAPSPRAGPIAYDSARDRVVLFGGNGPMGGPAPQVVVLGDTWEWDGAAWVELHPTTAPSPRTGHVLVFDAARQRTVLFGGTDATDTWLAETWEWDGVTWTQRPSAITPPSSAEYVAAYDPLRGVVVLVGHDTWEWDGNAWTQRYTVTTGPDTPKGAAYDPVRHVVVAHGSRMGAAVTMTLGFESVDGMAPERCLIAGEDSDGDGLAGCADPDCWGRCSPTCSPGTTCATPGCGDATCDPTEDYLLCPTDCPPPP